MAEKESKKLFAEDFARLDLYKLELMSHTLLKSGISKKISHYLNNFNFNLVDLILYDIKNYSNRESFNIRLDFYKNYLNTFNQIQLNEILIESIKNNVNIDFINNLIIAGASKNIQNIPIKSNKIYKNNFPKGFFRERSAFSCSRDRVLTKFLLDELGHPEKRVPKIIHCTGSNGKGSTCLFLRYILEANGYKVNCYTNPAVLRSNEDYIISGKEITDEVYDELMLKIKDAYDKVIEREDYKQAVEEANNYDTSIGRNVFTDNFNGVNIWSFSITLMVLAFAESGADYSIIEVRNGGLYDLTNVFSEKETVATILTYIQYGIGSNDGTMGIFNSDTGKMEHSNKATAYHKTMLSKKNTPIIVANQTEDVLEEIKRVAKSNTGAYTVEYNRDWFIKEENENSFIFEGFDKSIKINKSKTLFENFQTKNIATALATLFKLGIKLDDNLIQKGINNTRVSGRLQRVINGSYVDFFRKELEIISGFIKFNDGGVSDAFDLINLSNKYNYIIYTSNSKKILKQDIRIFKELDKLDTNNFKLLIYSKNEEILNYISKEVKKYNFNYEIKNNLSSCLTYVKDIIKDVKNSKLFILCDSMLCFDENIVYMNGDAY